MIYLVILLFLFLFAIQYDLNNYKVSNSIIFFWWLIFVLLAGLRYRVGGDTLFYINYFNGIPDLSDVTYDYIVTNYYQPFWVLLCSLCKSFSKDFTFFQFIHAIITNTVIFYFIKKNTDYFFTGILFYFIFYFLYFNMEVLRETLAICVFLLSLKYFFSNKWLIYYLFCFIAFMFHLSAIMLFFLPLFRIVWTGRTYFIVTLLILIIFILFKNNILMNILNIIPNEEIRFTASKYLGAKANINGIIYNTVVNILIPGFILFMSERILGYKSRFRPFLYLYIIIYLISIFLAPFYRFANYITPIYYLFLANMIHELFRHAPFRQFRYTIVLLIFLIPFSLHLMTVSKDTSDRVPGTRFYSIWYPYYTVFTKETDKKRERLIHSYGETNSLIKVKE